MRKEERQKLIKQLVLEESIGKQEELVWLLKSRGIPITQATVSRDIKELNLVKQTDREGFSQYILPTVISNEMKQLKKLIRNSFKDIGVMERFVSLSVSPGSGVAIGKLIETIYADSIFIVMTNDDKVFVVTHLEEQSERLEADILSML